MCTMGFKGALKHYFVKTIHAVRNPAEINLRHTKGTFWDVLLSLFFGLSDLQIKGGAWKTCFEHIYTD